jgi:hypothetical protein
VKSKKTKQQTAPIHTAYEYRYTDKSIKKSVVNENKRYFEREENFSIAYLSRIG